FDRLTQRYMAGVQRMLVHPVRWMLAFLLMCALAIALFARLPGGYLPSEDQGYFFAVYSGPPGGTSESTERAVEQAEQILRSQSAVRNIASVVGFSFFGQGQTAAMSFVDMYPWSERKGRAN